MRVSEGNSIQAAIDAADDGDVIEVDAGTYSESLVIGKSLTLTGDVGEAGEAGAGGSVVLDGEGLEAGISILGGTTGVTIQGFVIQDFTTGIDALYAGAGSSADVTVEGNTFSNNSYGIRAGNDTGGTGALNWTIAGNELAGNHHAIELDNAAQATVSGNQVSGGAYGIIITAQAAAGMSAAAHDITITGNTVGDIAHAGVFASTYARDAMEGTQAAIKGLVIEGNTFNGSDRLSVDVGVRIGTFDSSISETSIDGNTFNGFDIPVDDRVEDPALVTWGAHSPNEFIGAEAGDEASANADFGGGGENYTFIMSADSGNDVISDFIAGDTLMFEGFALEDVFLSDNDDGTLVITAGEGAGAVTVHLTGISAADVNPSDNLVETTEFVVFGLPTDGLGLDDLAMRFMDFDSTDTFGG